MELVSRMMEGSISYPPESPPGPPPISLPRLRHDQKIVYLQRVPVLQDCTQRQLRAISRITEVLEMPAGHVLAQAGEPGDHFFFIVDGTARVEVPSQNPPRVGPGEFFGEMSLLDGGPRSATVIAETPVRLLLIHRRDFWTLLREAPALTDRILIALSHRVRRAEKAINA